jgi:hypothetical protein
MNALEQSMPTLTPKRDISYDVHQHNNRNIILLYSVDCENCLHLLVLSMVPKANLDPRGRFTKTGVPLVYSMSSL